MVRCGGCWRDQAGSSWEDGSPLIRRVRIALVSRTPVGADLRPAAASQGRGLPRDSKLDMPFTSLQGSERGPDPGRRPNA